MEQLVQLSRSDTVTALYRMGRERDLGSDLSRGQAALPGLGSSPHPAHSHIKGDFRRWGREQPLPRWQTLLTSPAHQFYSRAQECFYLVVNLYVLDYTLQVQINSLYYPKAA